MATHSSILAWRIPWTEEPGILKIEISYFFRKVGRSGASGPVFRAGNTLKWSLTARVSDTVPQSPLFPDA